MARQRNAPAEPVEPPDGAFILPDPEAFTRQKPARTVDDPTRQAGRVIGLDYTQWAVATVDLDSAPDRVADCRRRYASKGYQKLDGKPIVVGFGNPEVWIIPRAMWLERKEQRGQRIADLVSAKILKPSAIIRPTVRRSDS